MPTVIDLSTLTPDVGAVIQGDAAGDRAGADLSSAGDVNGDGYDDLIIGAELNDLGGNNAGAAYVIFGRAGVLANIDLSNLTPSQGFSIRGMRPTTSRVEAFLQATSMATDLADVIVGAPGGDNGGTTAGEAYVIFGHAGSFANIDLTNLGAQGFIIQGDVSGDFTGYCVSAAGDFNGDGFDDMIVGAREAEGLTQNEGEGIVYVVFGHAGPFSNIDLSFLTPAQGFAIEGEAAGDRAGVTLSSAGDINGDGFDDIFIGAQANDRAATTPGRLMSSSAMQVGSRISTCPRSPPTSASSSRATPRATLPAKACLRPAISTATDLDDVVLGALGAGTPGAEEGRAYVIFGHGGGFADIDISRLTPAQGFTIQGDREGDFTGGSVASAGDVNGDGSRRSACRRRTRRSGWGGRWCDLSDLRPCGPVLRYRPCQPRARSGVHHPGRCPGG